MEKKAKSHKKRIVLIIGIVVLLGILIGGAYYWIYSNDNHLQLRGSDQIEIGLHGTYKELGAGAVIDGKDASKGIKISSNLDTTKPGTYTVTYSCGSLKKERQVVVGKKMNPELKLGGKEKTVVKLGKAYQLPEITATDENGKDISNGVIVGEIDFQKVGEYKVPFVAEDDKGNSTTIYRQVEVVANTDYKTAGLPICMYHYVYDKNDPPEDVNRRYGNYIEVHALEKELRYLKEKDYYFPSWKEVRDYIDGKLILPDRSIVLCFDDGAKSFLEVGIPALEKHQVPATCFMITSGDGKEKLKNYQSKYVSYQSHSDNMHRDGGTIGQGGIITALPEDEILADLEKSIALCGNGDAFAYPYGDYSDASKAAVEKAGFSCAVTTQYGKAYPGDDPYALDRIRMTQGQSLETFISRLK